MADAGKHHGIDYIEIYVTNMKAAQAFYGAAFGWKFTDYGPGYAGFSDGARGEREAGGLCLVDTAKPNGSLVILYSQHLQATADAVEQAGGSIEKPIFEFPGGRRFEFTDPTGNLLGVWGT